MNIVDRGNGPPLVARFPASRAAGSGCARRSTRWRSVVPRDHVSRCAASARRACRSIRRAASTTTRTRSQRVLDERRIERAAICGVSFGGLVALRFAARASRSRRAALVLASTPGPGWHLRRATASSTRARRGCFGPLFLAESPLAAAPRDRARRFPTLAARRAFARRQLRTLAAARRCRSSRMAARARMIATVDVGRRLRAHRGADAGRHRRARPRSRRAGRRLVASTLRLIRRRARVRARAHRPSRDRSRGRTRSPRIVARLRRRRSIVR